MNTLEIKDDFIKLGQALKLSNLVESGIGAKSIILEGRVLVNGEKQLQRGKKLYNGDIFELEGNKYQIKGNV